MEKNAAYPGKTLLKVVGIVLIVAAVVSIILGLAVLITGGATTVIDPATLSEALETEVGAEETKAIGGTFMLLGVLMLIPSIYNLVMGILGVKHCNRPEKGKLLLTLGIISLVLSAISLTGGMDWLTVLSLVLVVLYCAGAYMNLKAGPAKG